jgi:hypothetical protein
MDWQLVVDLGLVLNYMSKYVTKSDMANNLNVHRLVKSIHREKVSNDGKSTAFFLRHTMQKLLGVRMMSKQEKCHLMLGLPIVHCTHIQVNVNLKNDSRQVITDNTTTNRDSSNPNDTSRRGSSRRSEDEETETTTIMSLVDAYTVRINPNHWRDKEAFLSISTTLVSMTLLDFCLNHQVVQRGPNEFKKDCYQFLSKTI